MKKIVAFIFVFTIVAMLLVGCKKSELGQNEATQNKATETTQKEGETLEAAKETVKETAKEAPKETSTGTIEKPTEQKTTEVDGITKEDLNQLKKDLESLQVDNIGDLNG
ncbi:hypothetical protein J4457_00365 [Candidatus Woesearchaeota archaeon]|nr:hypothetical protein [Candidatus Woesearchaeota archaeon]